MGVIGRKSVVFVTIIGMIFISSLYAETIKRTAKLIDVKGRVNVLIAKEKKWVKATKGIILEEGDIIKTRAKSKAVLNLDGNGDIATVDIEENSELMLSELVKEKDENKTSEKTLLDLAIGKILIKVKKLHQPESKFEVKTPTSIVGVRGTIFVVEVESLE